MTIYERILEFQAFANYLASDNGDPMVDELNKPNGPEENQISMDKNVTFTFDFLQGNKKSKLCMQYVLDLII